MMMSKRERTIAILAGVGAILFLGDQMILSPYTARANLVERQMQAAKADLDKADLLKRQQEARKRDWAWIQEGGLKSDVSQAESDTTNSLLDWAQSAGVSVSSIRPERTTTEKQFQVITFGVTGTASMQNLSKLLTQLERTKKPIRLVDLQINPRKENSDDLSVRMSISTLCMAAEAKTDNKGAQR